MQLTYMIPNIKALIMRKVLLNQEHQFILTDPKQLSKSLSYQKIWIQWTPQNEIEMNKLLKMIQFLNKQGREVEVLEQKRIFDDDLLLKLASENYNFQIYMNYMLDSFLSGPNVTLNYSIKEYQEVIKKVKYFNQKVKECTKTEEERIIFVISQLAEYITYPDIENKSDQYMKHVSDFYAAIMRGESICIGYSMAAYKILNELNIPCKIIIGKNIKNQTEIKKETLLDSLTAHHAWNQIYLKGKWYNIDITSYKQTNDPTYLLRSDQDLHHLFPVPDYRLNICSDNYDQERIKKRLEQMTHYPNYLKQYEEEYGKTTKKNR